MAPGGQQPQQAGQPRMLVLAPGPQPGDLHYAERVGMLNKLYVQSGPCGICVHDGVVLCGCFAAAWFEV